MIQLTEKEYDKLIEENAELKKKVARYKSSDRETLEISKNDLKILLNESEFLKKRNQELLNELSKIVENHRKTNMLWNVEEFHNKFQYPVRKGEPTSNVPQDEAKHRARLIMEEAFETLASLIPGEGTELKDFLTQVREYITNNDVIVDLPELADGLVDLEYVIAGTHLAFSIPRDAVLEEVQRSNMSKDLSRDGLNKPVKPPGWTPPDVIKVLKENGWQPNEG